MLKQTIAERGIPAVWQDFGTALSRDAALSVSLVESIRAARATDSGEVRERALEVFHAKIANLADARRQLRDVMGQYDLANYWTLLDRVLHDDFDIDHELAELRADFGLHPFPVVLESLRANWTYMREHGVRVFYEMTDAYIERLEEQNRDGRDSLEREFETGEIESWWLFALGLQSVELPSHCDICRATSAPLIALASADSPIPHEHVRL